MSDKFRQRLSATTLLAAWIDAEMGGPAIERAHDEQAASGGSPMFGNDPAVLADHDAVRVGLDLNGPSERARCHRVLVVVEAHQTGLGDRGGHGVEAVEATSA